MLRNTTYQYGDLIGARGDLWTYDSEGEFGIWVWGTDTKEYLFDFLYFTEIEEADQRFRGWSLCENIGENLRRLLRERSMS